jgi:hypothetical protein
MVPKDNVVETIRLKHALEGFEIYLDMAQSGLDSLDQYAKKGYNFAVFEYLPLVEDMAKEVIDELKNAYFQNLTAQKEIWKKVIDVKSQAKGTLHNIENLKLYVYEKTLINLFDYYRWYVYGYAYDGLEDFRKSTPRRICEIYNRSDEDLTGTSKKVLMNLLKIN